MFSRPGSPKSKRKKTSRSHERFRPNRIFVLGVLSRGCIRFRVFPAEAPPKRKEKRHLVVKSVFVHTGSSSSGLPSLRVCTKKDSEYDFVFSAAPLLPKAKRKKTPRSHECFRPYRVFVLGVAFVSSLRVCAHKRTQGIFCFFRPGLPQIKKKKDISLRSRE